MEYEKLNSLANHYVETNDSRDVDDMYIGLTAKWSESLKTVAASLRTDAAEIQSMYNEVFVKSIQAFKGGDFAKLLSRNLRNARASFSRKQTVRNKYRYESIDKPAGEDAPTSELKDSYILEDHVYERMHKKKEADKIKLIDFLLESAEIHSDSDMAPTIDRIKRGESLYSIAKSKGAHPYQLDRKIRRLSRFYSQETHGDILDYFSVEVEVRRDLVTA